MNPRGEETTQKDGSTLVDQKQKHGRANETITVLEIIYYLLRRSRSFGES